MTQQNRTEELKQRYAAARKGGGEERIEKQHAAGKLTARERVEALLDPGSFQELDALVHHRNYDFGMEKQRIPGDGVITGHGRVLAWWSEGRSRGLWGDLVRPDAYGRYTHTGATLDFFLEFDLGTITLSSVAGKLAGYAELARSTGIVTPVLLWVPTTGRETTARRALLETWQTLPDPGAVPVATAAADLLDPTAEHPSPADRVWLSLDGHGGERLALHQLPASWPHLTPPPASIPQYSAPTTTSGPAVLDPPSPMPPCETGGS